MTLDEAIQHAEEIAEENENKAQIWHKQTKNRLVDFCDKALQAENNCIKCAEEYRQLAEWLKDYKRLKEQELCEKMAQERYADLCEYFGGAKDILKSRKDFRAWLERVKWHIHKAEELYEKYEYKKEPCTDAISRQAVLEKVINVPIAKVVTEDEVICRKVVFVDDIEKLPPVTPPKIGHCKDCKYFEYDYVTNVDGIPLILAHEYCKRWGEGCKTKEDGYCFLYEPKESEEE